MSNKATLEVAPDRGCSGTAVKGLELSIELPSLVDDLAIPGRAYGSLECVQVDSMIYLGLHSLSDPGGDNIVLQKAEFAGRMLPLRDSVDGRTAEGSGIAADSGNNFDLMTHFAQGLYFEPSSGIGIKAI